GRSDELIKHQRQMADWLVHVAPQIPEDLQLQGSLRMLAAEVAAELLLSGLDEDESSFARSMREMHSQLEVRLRSVNSDPETFAQWQLQFPIELVRDEELDNLIESKVIPAIERLKLKPALFADNMGTLLDRTWMMRNVRPKLCSEVSQIVLK